MDVQPADTGQEGPSGESQPEMFNEERPKESDPEDLLMCRVCRGNDGDLYYPCLCTGSIKYVHQECLVEWLKYSKKEVCELCNHKYSFQPIYRSDMPKFLPIFDLVTGILISVAKMCKTWVVYTLVMSAWLGFVPLTAARIYNFIFYMSFHDIIATPVHLFKAENVVQDIFKGSILLMFFVCTFISLVWLREQIILGGPQNFLHLENEGEEQNEQEGEDEEMENENEDEEMDGFEVDTDSTDGEGSETETGTDDLNEDDDGNRELLLRDIVAFRQPDGVERLMDRFDENNVNIQLPIAPPDGEQRPPRRRRVREREEAQDQEDGWRDWDRMDELTWQRLLGLDGSLIFLEHVFWVISLNTLFTVTFAYFPYRLGYFVLSLAGIQQKITLFPSIVAMLTGYIFVAVMLYVFHRFVGYLKLKLLYRCFGVMFLIIKVFLLVLMEIGLFPVMCGCWMDICTLPLFSATLSQRIATFGSSPFMSIFLHWMIGMVYVFYSASFVILLRELLRPGVLWFMRNLNDPEFNPIQEMIDLPFTRHFRRLIVSTTLFFTTILLIFYIPLSIIGKLVPIVLPYNVSMSADTPLSELSLELLLLQVVMPAILEHAHGRVFIKMAVKQWCIYVGKMLDLDRYLLSDNSNNANEAHERRAAAVGAGGGLAAEHQALLLLREPRAYEPYVRPSYFALRVAALVVLMALTTTICSLLLFIFPSTLGRATISFLFKHQNVHEIYTVGVGLYILWLAGKGINFIYQFVTSDYDEAKRIVLGYISLGFRLICVCIPVSLILPYLIGTLFQLVFLTPARLTNNQTALNFPYQDWAMGVLQMKIFAVVAMMGPDWWLKIELDALVQRGFDNFAAVKTLVRLVLPCILYLGSFLSFPVVLIKLYALVTGISESWTMLLLRFSYPTFLIITCVAVFLQWQIQKFGELAEQIKNDRYLVGTQLVNYEKNGTRIQ